MARNGPTPVWTSARKKFNQSRPRSVRAEGVTLRPKARCRQPVQPHHVLHQLRSEEHTSELQSLRHLVCRLLLEKKISILVMGTLDSADDDQLAARSAEQQS